MKLMDLSVSIQALDFSVTLPNIFGNNVNHLLNVFSPMQSGLTLTDETGAFYLGETYDLGGHTLEMMGSGFAIPGVSVLGVIVPTGFPVDVMIMQDTTTGQNFFVYPDGTPNLLSAVALVTNTSAEPYSAGPPVCFCSGTRIATPDGERPVELLRPGDKVLCADGRVRRVRWAGGTTHASLPPDSRPIVFRKNAFGPGLPARGLRLSPNHRLVLGPDRAPILLGPAKAFVGLPGVRQDPVDRPVGYHHVLLNEHAPVLAEGLAVESLLLGDEARRFLGDIALKSVATALDCAVEKLPKRRQAKPFGELLGGGQTRRRIDEIVARHGRRAVVNGVLASWAQAPGSTMSAKQAREPADAWRRGPVATGRR